MKEATFSIGAALQACAAQARDRQQPARTAPEAGARDRQPASPPRLTPRQTEVLALLCEGLPNKRICRRLNVATGTVKVHISCILRELGVKSRLEAVVAARRFGLGGDAARGEADLAAQRPPTTGGRQTSGRYGDAVAF